MNFLAALLLSSSIATAQNSGIFACDFKDTQSNKTTAFRFSMDSLGKAEISASVAGDETTKRCALLLDSIYDNRRGLVPNFRANFLVKECQIPLPVLSEIRLLVKYPDQKDPGVPVVSVLQWRRNKQPDTCKVKFARSNVISLVAKRWLLKERSRYPAQVE